MRFLFVDKVTSRSDLAIEGEKFFAVDSPFLVANKMGVPSVASGVIGEAIGQLVSWLVLERSNFKYRPVFAFIDKVEILADVKPGTKLKIKGRIDQIDDESVIFSGEAWSNGQIVQRVTRCTNFFMPLDQTEFESESRARFQSITSAAGGFLHDGGQPFDFGSLVQRFEADITERTVIVHCRADEKAPFYKDHFPKFPVTPIVVINQIIGLGLKQLVANILHRSNAQVAAREVKNLKIRSFVKPGEAFEIEIKPRSLESQNCTALVAVVKDGKRILQGQYEFEIWEES